MTQQIKLDKQALREFVALMRDVADEMSSIHPGMSHRYARNDGDATSAYRNGAKLTLGSLDYPHPGRQAGELLADRVADVLNFVKSLEEGARALGENAQNVLDEMGAQDSLSAADLARINRALPGSH